ncbi:Non-canonical non-ribosomal peptide synthetase ascB [Cladobotryum mycophilum]|uniref:Non-canonical non-ribosomal peptide synthetase ascB n=1 Tax=Cladobotryum mycophilum TaxID=491253 RepID=A0ABR0SHB3_9HYPO
MSSSEALRPFNRPPVNFASAERLEGHIHSLPELVDFNAVNNPDHLFCIQARSTAPFDHFTHAQFKIAVANCARWIQENVPLQPTTSPDALTKMAPVALFMESDFGLMIHEFALMSIGATSAASFIVSQRLSEPAKPALAALSAKGISTHVGLPYKSFHEPEVDVASKGTFDRPQELDSVILLLHSSGTTGLPKPITISHRQLLFAVNCHKFDTEEEAQALNVSSLPLFHGFGLVAPGLSMSAGKPAVYPATDGIPNALSIIELVKATKAKSMMTVPFLLDDICNLPNDEGIKALAHMDFVGTGGAALGAGVGDRLKQGGVKLLNFYGTTETGPLSLTFVPKDDYDWKYFRLRTDVNYKVDELEPRDTERRFRLTVFPFGGTEGIEIADQLIRNEQFPETDFAAVGRDDDVIVLATGEKANPLILETMLTEAPILKSGIAFGENQFNLGVIVEPAEPVSPEEEGAFKEKIWPLIVAAGQKMDAFSRIPSQDAVIIVPAGKVIPRTDKGSIARKEVYALFDAEIKEVYAKLLLGAEKDIEPLNLDDLENHLKDLIQKQWKLEIAPSDWSAEDNLFNLGLDSLQALQIRRVLISAAAKTEALKDVDATKLIPQEFIYVNPTVRQMADSLSKRSTSPADFGAGAAKEVEELIEKYSLQVSVVDEKKPSVSDNAVVLLTGSSGSLGSHLLVQLAQTSHIKRIVCLTRKGAASKPAEGTQYDRSVISSKGISLSEEEWSKVSALEVDPTSDKLGLQESDYNNLNEQVTHIVHAAWPMNYLTGLQSFDYQFKFLQSLLQLAVDGNGTIKRRFVFVSSIAAVAKVGLVSGGQLIPEAPANAAEAACGIGYADGKLVCEKVLERASVSHAGQLEVTYVRCGQITGARGTGVWNSIEQIPMLLRSAQTVGSLPKLRGTLSWIPVDDAAAVISEIAFSTNHSLPIAQHLENPVRQAWGDLVDSIGLQLGITNAPVPFDQWLEQVANAESDEDVPVKKLYAFFKYSFEAVACGQVILGTDVARTSSSTLRNMRAIDDATIQNYIRYWRDIDYLRK